MITKKRLAQVFSVTICLADSRRKRFEIQADVFLGPENKKEQNHGTTDYGG
jgi:hypothetical protein